MDFRDQAIVDARGLSCPQPVILTKKAMEKDDAQRITTVVDNQAALENVTKLAKSQGYDVTVEEKEGVYHIHMVRGEGEKAAKEQSNREIAVLIKSNRFGVGENELGDALMKSFLYALSELESGISHLIFMNSGVYLTTEGSPVLDHLQALSGKGVRILSCGTCLDYYGLKDKLQVGEITNMYAAVEILAQAPKSLVF